MTIIRRCFFLVTISLIGVLLATAFWSKPVSAALDPSTAAIVGTLELSGITGQPAVQGRHLVVGTTVPEMHVVDISDPTSPSIIGTIATMHRPNNFYIEGGFVYMTGPVLPEDGTGALEIYDIRDPSDPLFVSVLTLDEGPSEVVVAGPHAYISAFASLQIVRVANPARPRLLSKFDLPGGIGTGIDYQGQLVYLSTFSEGLSVIDVRRRRAPALLGNEDTGALHNAKYSDSYVFGADRGDGFVVIDVSDPANPAEVARVNTTNAMDVAVEGLCAVVADDAGGIKFFDVSDPTAPALVNTIAEPDGREVAWVVAEGGRAFVHATGRVHIVE